MIAYELRRSVALRLAHLRAALSPSGTYSFMPPDRSRCRTHGWATTGFDSCPACSQGAPAQRATRRGWLRRQVEAFLLECRPDVRGRK